MNQGLSISVIVIDFTLNGLKMETWMFGQEIEYLFEVTASLKNRSYTLRSNK